MGIILSILGWERLNPETEQMLDKHKRLIMVFPHTTKLEFFLYVLYNLDSKLLRERCHFLVNSKENDKNKWILDKFGAIDAGVREIKGTGGVQKVYEKLKDKESFYLLISPKGTLKPNEWRTGYYQMAKQLNCGIMPVGFDFDEHTFVVKEPIYVDNKSFEEVSEQIKNSLYDIVSLYPENNEYKSITDDVDYIIPCFMSYERKIFMMFLFILIIAIIIIMLIWAVKFVIKKYNNGVNKDRENKIEKVEKTVKNV